MKLTDALQTEQDGIIDANNTPKQAPAKSLVVKTGGTFGPQRLFDEV
jgi:hypothetical protein